MYIHAMVLRLFSPLLSLAVASFGVGVGLAQSAPSTLPSVPTTRILAIGRLPSGTTREKIMPTLKQEVPATLRLYLDGKLDQMYSRKDQNGVVFLLNVSTVEEAQSILEKLPLGQGKLMEFDLIPLGPLSPLALLLQPAAPAK